MSVRDGPLKPMTKSGHCAYGPDHSKCQNQTCTCDCHKQQEQTNQPIRRTRKKLL